MIKIQEAENQIITALRDLRSKTRRLRSLLVPSVGTAHPAGFGRAPELVTADPEFFSAANEAQG